MKRLSIRDLKEFRGKTVFCRVDYNVPLDEAGAITDDKRIKATIPTLDYLIKGGAKVVLASHLERPKGKRDPKQSLRPVAARLAELTGGTVNFADDCVPRPGGQPDRPRGLYAARWRKPDSATSQQQLFM